MVSRKMESGLQQSHRTTGHSRGYSQWWMVASLQIYRPFPVDCTAQECQGDRLYIFILASLLPRCTFFTAACNSPSYVCVCVCVCESVCVCVCMHMCMHACMCVCVHASLIVLTVYMSENVSFSLPDLCPVNMHIFPWEYFTCIVNHHSPIHCHQTCSCGTLLAHYSVAITIMLV